METKVMWLWLLILSSHSQDSSSIQDPLSFLRGSDEEWDVFMKEFKVIIETIDLISDDEAQPSTSAQEGSAQAAQEGESSK